MISATKEMELEEVVRRHKRWDGEEKKSVADQSLRSVTPADAIRILGSRVNDTVNLLLVGKALNSSASIIMQSCYARVLRLLPSRSGRIHPLSPISVYSLTVGQVCLVWPML